MTVGNPRSSTFALAERGVAIVYEIWKVPADLFFLKAERKDDLVGAGEVEEEPIGRVARGMAGGRARSAKEGRWAVKERERESEVGRLAGRGRLRWRGALERSRW